MYLGPFLRGMNCLRGISLAVVLASAFAFASSCSKPEEPGVKVKREFREALAVAVANASRIEVVEHSHVSDFVEIHGAGEDGVYTSDDFPTVEYARVRLNGEQVSELLRTVRAMDAAEPLVINLCASTPRHSIELRSGEGVSSRLEVCFSCRKLQWSDRDLQGDPDSWVDGLEAFVRGLGMQPQADWLERLMSSGGADAFKPSSRRKDVGV